MFSAPFLVTLLDRVKAIVRRVAGPPAERARLVSGDGAAPAQRPISPALRRFAEAWMSAKVRNLSAFMRRIRAGEDLDAANAGPGKAASGKAAAPVVRAARAPSERRPRGFGWMCGFGPNVRRDGQAFAAWLNQPEVRVLVLAGPQRMAQVIGPILTATGERRPDWFPVVPKRARRTVSPLRGGVCDFEQDAAGSGDAEDRGCGSYRSEPPASPRSTLSPHGGRRSSRCDPDAATTPLYAVWVGKRCFRKNEPPGELETHAHFVTASECYGLALGGFVRRSGNAGQDRPPSWRGTGRAAPRRRIRERRFPGSTTGCSPGPAGSVPRAAPVSRRDRTDRPCRA